MPRCAHCLMAGFGIYVAFKLSGYTLFIELKIIETLRAVRDV